MSTRPIALLLAAAIAGSLFAAESDQGAFKTFSSREAGVSFQYPGDFDVIVSTGVRTSIQLPYRPMGVHGPTNVEGFLTIGPCYSVESVLSANYRNPDVRAQILKAPTLNGFYVGDKLTDCGMGGSCMLSQHYVKQGPNKICYVFARTEWASKRWNRDDLSPDDQKQKDNLDAHYEALTEVVKSFRTMKHPKR
jgi:hypothetical protein